MAHGVVCKRNLDTNDEYFVSLCQEEGGNVFFYYRVKLMENLKKSRVDKTGLLTKYQLAKTAKKFCMAC